ncbi:hypothetical protein LP52_09940 [Streptomonospora alba]|uniref:Uncharacterized protein n=1 Tax=Streptomonospora alba TaxID=183763 RepID=A0A0C2G6T1_9ACTN|nr:hypothetical protein [Streptomonospora alba]KIH98998.1 hypothetical protein LP52_09940 [Streptomonospora alba]
MSRTAKATASVTRLPLYSLDLVRRYWAPLLCVYVIGTFLHDMMMRGVVRLSAIDQNLGLIGMTLVVLTQLTVTIVMFHLLRPGLPTVDRELVAASPRAGGAAERERRWVDAVAMAILPFLIFYNAWGRFAEEFRRYNVELINQRGLDGFIETNEINALGLPLGIALASFLLRMLCERFYRRTDNKTLGVCTALFEANWMFFGLYSIVQVFGNIRAWFTQRQAWYAVENGILEFMRSLGSTLSLPIEQAYLAGLEAVGQVLQHLRDGLFEPLLWLTIAAVVFGAEMDRHQSLFRKGSRAAKIEGALTADGNRLMQEMGRIFQRDAQDRWMPFVNALRFVLRASPVFYLGFCLYYVLLEVAFAWLERGIFVAVGPNEFLGWWWPWLTPISFMVDALHELLRVCLLAAAFEITLRSVGASSTGRRARADKRAHA